MEILVEKISPSLFPISKRERLCWLDSVACLIRPERECVSEPLEYPTGLLAKLKLYTYTTLVTLEPDHVRPALALARHDVAAALFRTLRMTHAT